MGGVDLFSDQAEEDPTTWARGENTRASRGPTERRDGALKLVQFSNPSASRTFAATTKYATFTPPLIPAGGWAVVLHFVATRTANTSWIVGSRPAGQTFHVLKATLSSTGVIVVTWRDSAGADHTVTCTAVADGTTVHLFAIFDAYAGTFTVYINGASSGTPLTGLAATLKPDQTASVVWTFGVEKETGQAVAANTNFDGLHDGMTLFTLRGTRPSTSGATTLKETLRRHSARVWPNPAMDFVLAHYDLDEASGTTMYDRSPYKNAGAYVGAPAVTAPVAQWSGPCNHIAPFTTAADARFNVVGSAGRLFQERVS